ncbi:MAG: hypothetical protein GOU98_05025 [Candidatus Altiarchaeota archaeon]|nr:hypothetical protein [Candidatus Altiarchaeota archaeon]
MKSYNEKYIQTSVGKIKDNLKNGRGDLVVETTDEYIEGIETSMLAIYAREQGIEIITMSDGPFSSVTRVMNGEHKSPKMHEVILDFWDITQKYDKKRDAPWRYPKFRRYQIDGALTNLDNPQSSEDITNFIEALFRYRKELTDGDVQVYHKFEVLKSEIENNSIGLEFERTGSYGIKEKVTPTIQVGRY